MKISPFITLLSLLYFSVNTLSGLEQVQTQIATPFDFGQDSNRIVQIIKPESSEDYVSDLSQSLDFSQMGIDDFFHRFNHKLYGELVLPNGALSVHVIGFCRQGLATEQESDFYNSLFRVFCRRIKSAPYMDAEDVQYFIGKLPELLGYLYESEQKNNSSKSVVKEMLYDELSNNFEVLQERPEQFIDNLSRKICSNFMRLDPVQKGDVSPLKLRTSILKITDAALSKMVWAHPYNKEIWTSYKGIIGNILNLKVHHILNDHEDVKDLIDSATIQFCHFVNLAGGLLPVEFYHAVHEDLKTHIPGLDDYEEELDSISTLREIIQATMIENVAKSIAKERFGIITQEIMKS